MPLREKTIAGEPDLQLRRCRIVDAVKILFVFRDYRAQLLQIEERISRFYRLERPFDRPDTEPESPLPLCPFETSSDAGSLKPGADGGHMRVKSFFAAQKRRDTQDKSNQFGARICSERKTASVPRDDKMPNR
jgi:hypothetical protein